MPLAAISESRWSRPVAIFVVLALFVVTALAVVSVSQPAAVASQLNYNVHMFVNGLNVNGWTVNSCPSTESNGTGPWVCSVVTNGVIENNSLTFLTGQKVLVNLWFEYLKSPADPATISFSSVSVGSGFEIAKIEESVPFSMSGWGAQAGLVILLDVLQGQHSGSVDMYVRFSG